MTVIILPWPPRALSPNARVHWSRKAAATREYRRVCAWQSVAQHVSPRLVQPGQRILLSTHFVPPSRRRYDRDNLIASIKAAFDGLADAMHVDDHRFDHAAPTVATDHVGGYVRITITPQENP